MPLSHDIGTGLARVLVMDGGQARNSGPFGVHFAVSCGAEWLILNLVTGDVTGGSIGKL
jgi:hypothetical protein